MLSSKSFRTSKDARGFTILEFLLVLVVAAVLIAIVFAAYKRLSSKSHVQAAAQGSTTISGQISGYFRQNFAGLSEQVLINAGLVPSNNVAAQTCTAASPACLISAWGNGIGVQPVDLNGGSNNGYAITYLAVPQSDCAQFVQSVAGQFIGVELLTGSTGAATTEPTITPLTPTTAADAATIMRNGLETDPTKQNASAAQIATACATAGTFDVALIGN